MGRGYHHCVGSWEARDRSPQPLSARAGVGCLQMKRARKGQGGQEGAGGPLSACAQTAALPPPPLALGPMLACLKPACLRGGRCPGWLPTPPYVDRLGQGPSDPSLEGFTLGCACSGGEQCPHRMFIEESATPVPTGNGGLNSGLLGAPDERGPRGPSGRAALRTARLLPPPPGITTPALARPLSPSFKGTRRPM